MFELPLILLSGVLGSSHCIGMCGGFVLTIGSATPHLAANLRRQLVYTLGRLFTYSSLGAAAAFGGWRLAQAFPAVVNLPAALAIVAGLVLVYQGLRAVGWIGRKRVSAANGPCLAGTMFASILTSPGLLNAFLAGVLTGFLPCGLLYAMLALAAATNNMAAGALLMAVFGIGTAPVMLITGCGGSLLGLVGRQRLYTLAAWCVVVTGVLSIARGCGFVTIPGLLSGGCCH